MGKRGVREGEMWGSDGMGVGNCVGVCGEARGDVGECMG